MGSILSDLLPIIANPSVQPTPPTTTSSKYCYPLKLLYSYSLSTFHGSRCLMATSPNYSTATYSQLDRPTIISLDSLLGWMGGDSLKNLDFIEVEDLGLCLAIGF